MQRATEWIVQVPRKAANPGRAATVVSPGQAACYRGLGLQWLMQQAHCCDGHPFRHAEMYGHIAELVTGLRTEESMKRTFMWQRML